MAEDATDHFDDFAPFVDAQWRADEMPDVDFYVDAAREADGPVLELGCGTGRVYLPTLAAGVDADGVDLAPGMLSVLRERAADRGLEPSVWQADVTDLAVDREYALVTFPFRGFLHLVDREAQLAALRNVREALAPDGQFALNFFAPSFEVVCERYGETDVSEFTHDGTDYRLETTTTLTDEVGMVARTEKRLYVGHGSPDDDPVRESAFPLKLLPKREFEALLELAGFSDWRVFDGFDPATLDSETDAGGVGSAAVELVWVVDR